MAEDTGTPPKLRLDKWLWQARFFKTRSLAAKQVSAGHVRVNGTRVGKPARTISPGDVLTFVQARKVRVICVDVLGDRRGPAPEAQALYTDLTPEPDPAPTPPTKNPRFEGKGRPDKRQRRVLAQARRQMPE